MTNTYNCKLTGYLKSDPNVIHKNEMLILAESVDSAHFKLFDMYCHIENYCIKNIGNENDFKDSRHIH